jgi:predicted NBD/HSP70 family sugar kinase
MHDFLYVKLAHGPGGAVVLDGRVHRGRSGLAGEIAHVHIIDEGPMCWCGGRGCLVAKVNPIVVIEDVRQAHPQLTTMAEVLALARAGDAAVLRVLTDVGRTVGRSLATFCAFMNPDGIVLDGELGAGGAAVEAGVREALGRFAPPDIARDIRVVVGALASNATLIGASVLARSAQGQAGRATSFG